LHEVNDTAAKATTARVKMILFIFFDFVATKV